MFFLLLFPADPAGNFRNECPFLRLHSIFLCYLILWRGFEFYRVYLCIRNPKLLDSANIFVFNISLGDFIYSIVALPMLVMSNAKGKWLFGEAGCKAYGFITTFFALGSMMNLVGASYERYVTLVKLYRNGEADSGVKKAL